ncbi:UNVERIFIED_CONTAM: hypothetical protein Slati_1156100 [Sesamum latifolium]|uniref:Uncharacterized protein n=1 Tax=Sesamum latifolium TaxID=2727402 RepID=A0AAW2XCD3_9LAMI
MGQRNKREFHQWRTAIEGIRNQVALLFLLLKVDEVARVWASIVKDSGPEMPSHAVSLSSCSRQDDTYPTCNMTIRAEQIPCDYHTSNDTADWIVLVGAGGVGPAFRSLVMHATLFVQGLPQDSLQR